LLGRGRARSLHELRESTFKTKLPSGAATSPHTCSRRSVWDRITHVLPPHRLNLRTAFTPSPPRPTDSPKGTLSMPALFCWRGAGGGGSPLARHHMLDTARVHRERRAACLCAATGPFVASACCALAAFSYLSFPTRRSRRGETGHCRWLLSYATLGHDPAALSRHPHPPLIHGAGAASHLGERPPFCAPILDTSISRLLASQLVRSIAGQ
jgi:hypothetical protein